MSKGDNLIGIKTTYKGIEMRSRLETKVAMFLDALKIKWEYEPKTFLLSDGTPYRPDFFLTEDNIWIEVKGLIEEHNKQISLKFVEENKTTLIMISSSEMRWYSLWCEGRYENGKEIEKIRPYEDKDVLLGFCPKCNRHFFASNLGDWRCSKCEYWNGDSTIKGCINGKNWIDENIDFSDIESIKRWLDARKISV